MSGKCYKPGDLIHEEKPLAYVVFAEHQGEMCEHCFKSRSKQGIKVSKCARCEFVSYCGKDCQRKAWPEHKNECPYLGNLEEDHQDLLRLIGRVIFRLKNKDWTSFSAKVGEITRTFQDLMSHYDDIKNDPKNCLLGLEFIQLMKDYIGPNNLPNDDQLLEIIGKVLTNRFKMDYGEGFYIGASIFDHACIPDAFRYFNGRTMKVRATTTIRKGDIRKVTITYIGSFNTFEEDLKTFYGPCKCQDCIIPYGESKLTKILDKNKAFSVIHVAEKVLLRLKVLEEDSGLNPFVASQMNASYKSLLNKMNNVLGKSNLLYIRLLRHLAMWSTGSESDKYFKDLLEAVGMTFGETSAFVNDVLADAYRKGNRTDYYGARILKLRKILFGNTDDYDYFRNL